jgi:hypothetical protein
MWNVQLYDFLNTAPISLINEISLPGFNIRLDGDGFNSKLNYGLKISRFLKNRPRAERLELWQSMDKVMQECDFSLTRMMNREEIIGISEQCEIGAHSYSHESMEFEENSFFEDDLLKCTAYFNERLNLPLETYAFPNGSFRTEQIEILRKNGIKNILLVGEDYAKTTEDVFPRFTIYGPSIVETKFQALGINKKI